MWQNIAKALGSLAQPSHSGKSTKEIKGAQILDLSQTQPSMLCPLQTTYKTQVGRWTSFCYGNP